MDLSVVTCVYNQNPLLFEECARSVWEQSGIVEWIVVDDGSMPAARKRHASVVSSLPPKIHTVFVPLKQNVGLSAARNVALQLARGNWIVVLDSDDCLASGLTESLLALSPSIALVCFEVNYRQDAFVEHRTLDYFEALFADHGGTETDPFLWYDFYYHGIIARRDLLERVGGYEELLRVGEDQDILLRSLEMISKCQIGFIRKIGYEYRCNSVGVCKTLWPEVLLNYTRTMLAAANRRGATFRDCRFGGTEEIEGCLIDYYEYQDKLGEWHNFHKWLEKKAASSTHHYGRS